MDELVAATMDLGDEAATVPLQILVASSHEDLRADIAAAIKALGHPCRCVATPGKALEMLQQQPGFNILMLDRGMDESGLCDAARPFRDSSEAGLLGVVRITDAVSDPAAPAVPSVPASFPAVTVSLPITSATLSVALARIGRELATLQGHDPAADMQRQLQAIAGAVIKLGKKLTHLARGDDPQASPAADMPDKAELPVEAGNLIDIIRSVIGGRRVRERYFPNARFGEPAWDILLDLTLAWLEEKVVSVSSLCIASGVPMSTAMRWVNEMIDAGLIERWIDPTDGRRHLVQMTADTRTAMLSYMSAIYRIEIVSDTAAAAAPATGNGNGSALN